MRVYRDEVQDFPAKPANIKTKGHPENGGGFGMTVQKDRPCLTAPFSLLRHEVCSQVQHFLIPHNEEAA